MGDPSVEVSEENRDASQDAKMQAMEANSEGNVHIITLLVYFYWNYNSCVLRRLFINQVSLKKLLSISQRLSCWTLPQQLCMELEVGYTISFSYPVFFYFCRELGIGS